MAVTGNLGDQEIQLENAAEEATLQRLVDLFDQKFVKMWEFYLASCSAAFKYRDLVVFQYQLVKNFDAIPSNRRDYIYT